jgi:hypothetical protein
VFSGAHTWRLKSGGGLGQNPLFVLLLTNFLDIHGVGWGGRGSGGSVKLCP